MKKRIRNDWKNISVLLQPETFDYLSEVAQHYGTTKSEIVRYWIEKHIKSELRRGLKEE